MLDRPFRSSVPAIDRRRLDSSIAAATKALLGCQLSDGHWVFELEADVTIPAEYILLKHYLDEPLDPAVEEKFAVYLRRQQGTHGGWPLFQDGDFDMSASVKAYFALKMIGDSPDAPHMARAREAIRARGGARHSNVFTRVQLSLYGVVNWTSVPVMPVEIMLLPRWFPFHLSKISYWGRTVTVPLLVLRALKPRAKNPRGVSIEELFLENPRKIGTPEKAPHQNAGWFHFFRVVDKILRVAEPWSPLSLRKRAIARAVEFVTERLNGEDGLGAIYPAMANTVMMFEVLGYPKDHPDSVIARASVEKLVVINEREAYCQPCVSPIWDTGLACHALMESGDDSAVAGVRRGLKWLLPKQVLNVKGDWAERSPDVRPGGWPFQYANPYYPDLDDTAMVVMALDRMRKRRPPCPPTPTPPSPARGGGTEWGAREGREGDYETAIARAREWIEGLVSRNGAWGAFDADNTHYWLNNIPFADHGALLDPPTEDVTARCISMLAQLGERPETNPTLRRAIDYLRETQLKDGSWYGRWGLNYIYGTWSVLCALNAAGVDHSDDLIGKAADWLVSIQNPDGGWGEDGASYKLDYHGHEPAPSTASQTAWALLGLMAAGRTDHPAVERGVAWLSETQNQDGFWTEPRFTATGFPRVFYLRYHGYRKYFPLWALARYRTLKSGNSRAIAFGM